MDLSEVEKDDFFRIPYFMDIHLMLYLGYSFFLNSIKKFTFTSATTLFWTSVLSI